IPLYELPNAVWTKSTIKPPAKEFYNEELQIELSETIKNIVNIFNDCDENRQ
ncbi:3324_t:CDS:2, partial [Scutellospora calospora]